MFKIVKENFIKENAIIDVTSLNILDTPVFTLKNLNAKAEDGNVSMKNIILLEKNIFTLAIAEANWYTMKKGKKSYVFKSGKNLFFYKIALSILN